jgi:hypothetical protein
LNYGVIRRIEFNIRQGARDFSLLRNVHAGSAAHPASYSMGTGGFSGGKPAKV